MFWAWILNKGLLGQASPVRYRGWQAGDDCRLRQWVIISYGLKVRIRLLLFELPCRLLRNFFLAIHAQKKQPQKGSTLTPPQKKFHYKAADRYSAWQESCEDGGK